MRKGVSLIGIGLLVILCMACGDDSEKQEQLNEQQAAEIWTVAWVAMGQAQTEIIGGINGLNNL